MEYLECIEKRYSCRKFKDQRISREELNTVLQAGILAPTACNFQPERIFVIEDEKVLEALKEATRYTFDAKTILVICHDTQVSWHRRRDNKDHGMMDMGIVATHMVLAATSLGLGTCFVCAMDPLCVKRILDLPESYDVDILLPIGYPDEVKPHNTRKAIEEIVSYR